MNAPVCFGFLFLLLLATVPAQANDSHAPAHATIVYDDVATELPAVIEDAGQLWISVGDLKRATRFELKPQGVCRDELCFPLPKARTQDFLRPSDENKAETQAKNPAELDPKHAWFNLTGFATLVHQPVAHDAALSVWYFGLRSDQRQQLASLRAPDFTLPDMNGKKHSLSDFRGKKVFLVTWASW